MALGTLLQPFQSLLLLLCLSHPPSPSLDPRTSCCFLVRGGAATDTSTKPAGAALTSQGDPSTAGKSGGKSG